MDGTGVRQRIRVESAAGLAHVIEFEIPFRLPRLNRLARHPCGETLIEPNIVPPFHGNQVAEPLVSHLMSDHRCDLLFHIDGALLVVDQENDFAKRDTAGIFHRARGKIRQADQIEFPVGILDAEIFVVVTENVLRRFQRELPHLLFSGRAVDPDRYTVSLAFDVLEVAHDQGRQVRRHFGCGGEAHRVLVARSRRIGNNLLVRDCDFPFVGNRGDVERGLVRGFVE